MDYDLGNGICKYLTDKNKCAIYKNRPDICSVECMYKNYYNKYFSKEEFYLENEKICVKLKSAAEVQ